MLDLTLVMGDIRFLFRILFSSIRKLGHEAATLLQSIGALFPVAPLVETYQHIFLGAFLNNWEDY
jgi:hypothetical protein